ncbi:unnamed protein product [Rotaria magnacalcarata]
MDSSKRNKMRLLLLSAASCKRSKKKQQEQQSLYLSPTNFQKLIWQVVADSGIGMQLQIHLLKINQLSGLHIAQAIIKQLKTVL